MSNSAQQPTHNHKTTGEKFSQSHQNPTKEKDDQSSYQKVFLKISSNFNKLHLLSKKVSKTTPLPKAIKLTILREIMQISKIRKMNIPLHNGSNSNCASKTHPCYSNSQYCDQNS